MTYSVLKTPVAIGRHRRYVVHEKRMDNNILTLRKRIQGKKHNINMIKLKVNYRMTIIIGIIGNYTYIGTWLSGLIQEENIE